MAAGRGSQRQPSITCRVHASAESDGFACSCSNAPAALERELRMRVVQIYQDEDDTFQRVAERSAWAKPP